MVYPKCDEVGDYEKAFKRPHKPEYMKKKKGRKEENNHYGEFITISTSIIESVIGNNLSLLLIHVFYFNITLC